MRRGGARGPAKWSAADVPVRCLAWLGTEHRAAEAGFVLSRWKGRKEGLQLIWLRIRWPVRQRRPAVRPTATASRYAGRHSLIATSNGLRCAGSTTAVANRNRDRQHHLPRAVTQDDHQRPPRR